MRNCKCAAVRLLLALLLTTGAITAQDARPTFSLETDRRLREMPIEITSIQIASESHSDLRKIPYSAKGIEGFKVSYKNISSKPIAFVKIGFLITPAGDLDYGLVFRAIGGEYPNPKPVNRKSNRQPLGVGANGVAEVSSQTTASFSRRLAEANVRNIGQLNLDSLFVVFSDGTGWENGATVYQDSTDPFTWRPENPERLSSSQESNLRRIEGDFDIAILKIAISQV